MEMFELDKTGLKADVDNSVRLQLAEVHSAMGSKVSDTQVKVRAAPQSRIRNQKFEHLQCS